jgi:RHH-type proline utilization regulon transcriptional repressor/proline dehydrogenase/delta 1-pyrroline-5-carboxylate dehydrogenase
VSGPDNDAARPSAPGWRSLTTPLVRTAMQFAIRALSDQFIFGHSIQAALSARRRGAGRAYRYSFDMLGEAALTAHDAQRYFLAVPAGHTRGRRGVSRSGAARRRQRVGETIGAASTLRLHAARARHA